MPSCVRTIICGALLTSSLCVFSATPSISIRYSTPLNKQEKNSEKAIKASHVNEMLLNISEHYFYLKQPLVIEYGGKDGPLYDPDSHVIYIPYSFYQEALGYFSKHKYQERFHKSPQQGAVDTLLHTLLHEVSHAFIEDQQIPVLGKEEDAADNFANVILLNYVNNGDDIAISAADMFSFESEDKPARPSSEEYIDEHSFDLQRYFSTLCLVYGSDPKKHNHLLNEIKGDYLKDRKDFCVSQFELLTRNWGIYLKQSNGASLPCASDD